MEENVYGDQNLNVPVHLNFGKYIFDRIRLLKDEIALENADTGEKLTYKELTQYAVDLSVALLKLGVTRGDVVAFGTEKRITYISTALGIIFTGATLTPYGIHSGGAILKHKIDVVSPTYLVCSELFWNKYCDVLENVETIKTVVTLDSGPKSAISLRSLISAHFNVERFAPADVRGQHDTAIILYSSGTTKLPKAIQLSHLNCILQSLFHGFESMNICVNPGIWAHNYIDFMTYKFLAAGKKIVYLDNVSSDNILKTVEKCKVDIAFLLPVYISDLANIDTSEYDLNSFKIIYSRSAPLHKSTIEKIENVFQNNLKVMQGYGITECGEVTSEIRGLKGPKPGSVGMAAPGVTLKIVDLKTGHTLGENQLGEVYVKGSTLMQGYYGAEDSMHLDDQGYFRTGDIGYFDQDKYFYIVGRLTEIIVNDGFKVSPSMLESLLQQHPGVKEAAVIGKPDPLHTELPTAFVVKREGFIVTEQELIEYVASEVSPDMHLTGGLYFINQIPKNENGKILRNELKKIVNERFNSFKIK